MTAGEMETAINQLFDGTVSEGDARELQAILKSDAAARRTYLEHARLHRTLECRFGGSSPARAFSRFARARSRAQQRKIVGISVLAACAAVLLIGILLSVFMAPAATVEAAKQSIFSIENPKGAEAATGTLVDGSRVQLEQGTLALKFAGGSRTVIQGPADLTVISGTQVQLNRGTAWFLISKKDRGFRVTTAELDVVDLGTDFGVAVPLSKPHEVHVFSGTVEARAIAGAKTKHILHGGEARKVDELGRLEPVEPDADKFLRELPAGLTFLHFSFDETDGKRIPVTGNHPAVAGIRARIANAAASTGLVPGVFGNALKLVGSGDHVITDWPGIAGNAPRTITCWVKVAPGADLTRVPGIAGWGDPAAPTGKWKILLIQEKPGGPAYPRISIGQHAYDAPVAANDGKWHHLAMSFDGTMGEDRHPNLSIYLDGVRQSLRYLKGRDPAGTREPITTTGPYNLAIGAPIGDVPGSFPGLIDELTIYAGVLPENAIREQAQRIPSPKTK